MRLYLVRHGQTSWNVAQKAQGHTDIPLDDEGLRQAEMLAEAFAPVQLAEVLTSDLRRSEQTAEPIARATGAPLVREPRLRERSFGDWEGLPFDQLRLNTPADPDEAYVFRPPSGESFQDVWHRLEPVIEGIRSRKGDKVVVTHGGSCALLLAKLLNGHYLTSRSFRFGNAAVVELELRPDGFFTLLRYNDTSHLRSEVISGGVDGTHR